MKLLNKLFLLTALFLSSNIFAGEDKLNAIMNTVSQKLYQLEIKNHVEIGLSAIETYNNTQINYHANKRFPMDSTSKIMTISAILKKSESDPKLLEQKIFFTENDVKKSGYAPVTRKHIQSGMTVSDLCAAALEYSDNLAANQLMKILGGPNEVTQFARSIGDEKYLLVRWEPELNSAIPSDKRDTTTPSEMSKSVQKLVLGNALGNSERQQLQNWMKQCKTGNNRIRAGVPRHFIVADKTGTGSYGSISDIGVIWRTQASPIVLAVYVRKNKKNAHIPDRVIAQATKIVMNGMATLR